MRAPGGGNGVGRSRQAVALVAAAVVGLLAAAACSSSAGGIKPIGADRATSTAASSSTTSSTAAPVPTTTSVDATEAAVLAAYRGMFADGGVVGSRYPINVSDPRLTNHMAGDELTQVQKFLADLKFQNQYVAGPPIDTSKAIVKQLFPRVAVVSDCDFDGSVIVDGTTHQVVKPAATQRALVNAKVELLDGVWKVTLFSNVSVGCTTAS